MAQVMNEAVKKYNNLSTVAVVSAVAFLLLGIWGALQYEWGWGGHAIPTVAFALAALFVMLIAFANLERLKKQHDLVTYREVLAFSRGEHVDRDTLAGQHAREMQPWKRGVLNSLKIILGAAVGGAVGIGIGMLIKMLA